MKHERKEKIVIVMVFAESFIVSLSSLSPSKGKTDRDEKEEKVEKKS